VKLKGAERVKSIIALDVVRDGEACVGAEGISEKLRLDV